MIKHSNMHSVRTLLLIFIISLFISGLTAIPVHSELSALEEFFMPTSPIGYWISEVHLAYNEVDSAHPFLFYGYDWLAFAHFILAILFIGPYRDPVKNIWVIQVGIIACVLVIPFAFIAGQFRGIPIGWRLLDCSFGIIGFILLWSVLTQVKRYTQPTPNFYATV
jgi:hypothetical protein